MAGAGGTLLVATSLPVLPENVVRLEIVDVGGRLDEAAGAC